ncbi:hypothetical protein OEZ85_012597 [Tetradesmus obliquus]|uniref:Transglutaminase-like domain-containing protein n=1 Tax=Tetradesmus obliquus TaxID=3088 RepID=A0ABY8U5X2_TETOB|nr:hypothetical protein OEZ85_012597 [Tetradesmus obliquus]
MCGAAVDLVQAAITDIGAPADNSSAPQLPRAAAAPQQARECLLRTFNSTDAHTRERKVFSQYGEDGILEAVLGCIGTTDRYYVEFGVEAGTQCTTRNLREAHNFTGLMMDGSNSRPEINQQQEMMFSHNIAALFKKYNVPRPGFDHMTVDLDQNTFWVALEVLRGGYRPRSLAVEINRNLAWKDSYATVDMPEEMWASRGDCYYGASTKAFVVMLRSFGYHHVYSDAVGVNAFFVHASAVGEQPLISIADAQRAFTKGGEFPLLHGDCQHHAWVRIDDGLDYSHASLDVSGLPVAVLGYTNGVNSRRVFYEVKIPAAWQARLSSSACIHAAEQDVPVAHKLAQIPASAAAADIQQQFPARGLEHMHAGAGGADLAGTEAVMQAWSVGGLVVMAFACGVLVQRFGGHLLHAGAAALRKQQGQAYDLIV